MDANFDMNALGVLFSLAQQKKETEKAEDEITLTNLGQFISVLGENINKLAITEVVELLFSTTELTVCLDKILKFANKIQKKYNFDIDN